MAGLSLTQSRIEAPDQGVKRRVFPHHRTAVRAVVVHRRRAGAGQDGSVETIELGAAGASAQPGVAGLGSGYREGLGRHHQGHAVSVGAAGQGDGPLRHGARWDLRFLLRQSRIPARAVPDHRRRRAAVPGGERKGGSAASGCLVSQICTDRDEGRALLLRLHARSGNIPFAQQEDRGAGGHPRREGAAGRCHDGGVRDAAGRHERAGFGAGGARGAGARRRRCDHLSLALDDPVRPRQGGEVLDGHAVLQHDLRVGDEQGKIRVDVAGAEGGDRQPLHDGMGREGRDAMGQLGARRDASC